MILRLNRISFDSWAPQEYWALIAELYRCSLRLSLVMGRDFDYRIRYRLCRNRFNF